MLLNSNHQMEKNMAKTLSILFATLFISSGAFAQWELINDESTINFISVKKSAVGEVHHFKSLNGTINDSGKITISVALSSAETGIAIRNDRLKSMLFEIASFPKATINASIDPNIIAKMKVGDSTILPTSFKASLHGISDKIVSDIRIVKLNDNKLLAMSVKPIIINTHTYKLSDGIELLRKAAKLPSISTAVPVSFSLLFSQK